jgi:hypothetical protein
MNPAGPDGAASRVSDAIRATRAIPARTASAPYISLVTPPDVDTVTSTEPSPAGTAVISRTVLPPACSTAVTFPAPSSRTRRVETRVSPSYRSTVADVPPPSRASRRTDFPPASACSIVTGPDAMELLPDQNSTRLKMRKSRVAVKPYGMMKSQVTALRRYLSSTDLLTSYSWLVSGKLPKQPADSAPNATTSTAAVAATDRFPRMPLPPLPEFTGTCPL